MRLQSAITDPVRVQLDVDYPTTRQSYYRPNVYRSQGQRSVKLVVEFKEPDTSGLIVGSVVTVNLVNAIPRQEERVWPL